MCKYGHVMALHRRILPNGRRKGCAECHRLRTMHRLRLKHGYYLNHPDEAVCWPPRPEDMCPHCVEYVSTLPNPLEAYQTFQGRAVNVTVEQLADAMGDKGMAIIAG